MKSRWQGWKQVLTLAWPLILANSFWNLQLTIDRVFLSNYSTDALGAAMAVMGVFWTPMALLQQTAAYSMTFVAQYFGAKKQEQIGSSIWQSIYISVAGGLLFLLLIPLAPAIFSMIGHSDKMQPLEVIYFQSIAYSALPTAIVAALSGFYTGVGKSQFVMWINGVGLIANVILDYLLIFGNLGFPALGLAGAGYATAGANVAAALFAAYKVFSQENEKLYRIKSSWKWNFNLMKQFLKYGLPSGLQWSLEGLAFTVFLVYVGRMPNGDAALSASGIAVTIMMLSVLPALGVGQGVSALVGQFLGENNPAKAEQMTWYGVQISVLYIFIMGLTFILFPSFYTSWFRNPADLQQWEQVAKMVTYLLMFIALFTLFDSLNLVLSFALKGAGDTRFVTLVALTVPWPLMVFPTWYFSDWTGGVYWAWAAASLFIIVQSFVFLWRFLGGRWKSMRVI